MEQGRVIIAIALSFVVFFAWNFFFVEKPDVKQPEPVSQTEPESSTSGPTVAVQTEKSTEETMETKPAIMKNAIDARTITVKTPLYTVRVDEAGAVFKSFKLENYMETADPESPKKELIDSEVAGQNLKFSFAKQSVTGLDTAVFSTDEPGEVIDVMTGERVLTFSWQSESGVVVEKRFTFSPDSYLIGMTLILKNGSGSGFSDSAVIEIQNYSASKKGGYAFEGPSALIGDNLEQIKIKKIKDKNRFDGEMQWIAIEDRYFMKSLIPAEPLQATMKLSLVDESLIVSRLQSPEKSIASGDQVSYEYQVFFGPKSMKLLNSLGYNLGEAIQFGMFGFIAKPLLWFMNFIFSIIPNYGVAIIILTIVTKIVLWPLGNKSYKSMNEMKKIQPLMAELREKHKNDKKQMNQELMALYKTYKINPMGGCLPMVLQIPVFFALYRMLYQAIELRHTPFLLWINDLSAPDRLFHFGFSIPFMQPPYGIPVLTLVMGATMFLQQKMSPPPGRPRPGQNDDADADCFHLYFHQLLLGTCLVLVGQ